MNLHAVICTRSREEITETTDKLLSFLCRCHIGVYLVVGAESLFSAYTGSFEKINPGPDDIIIFCHDDIELREDPQIFISKLTEALATPETGFVGAAGTRCLGLDAVWWEQARWKEGKHRGKVIHIDPQGQEYLTPYGDPGDVVVLDGLFLAAKRKVLDEVGLQKPEYFEGEWDFYDIYYTSQAFLKGFTNKVVDLNILHNSLGELVGRESWHKNRQAFISHTNLPLEIKE